MSKLYILTGPAGVGKSTISKKIAKSCSKSVLIDGDDIYHQVISSYIPAWKDGNHLAVFWEVCLNMIKTYLDFGYDVVFNYIINPENIINIKENLKDQDIKFVILLTDKNTLLQRDSQRPEECQMKDRCITLLHNFKNKNYNINNILDTSKLSIEDTTNEIINNNKYLI